MDSGISNAIEANAFDFLRERHREGARYDTIILDPPAFAKNKESVEAALRGYKEINNRAMRLLRPGGILMTCSCSHHVAKGILRKCWRRRRRMPGAGPGCWKGGFSRRIIRSC